MIAQLSTARSALEPVTVALLRRAHDEAKRVRANAEAEARRVRDEAGSDADRTLRYARSDGKAAARAAATTEWARTRRSERARELAARHAAYLELRHKAIDAAGALRDDPVLCEALRSAARRLLGPHAIVTDHPDGGVIAEADDRRLDLTLSTLAVRALERLGPEMEGLWAT